MTITTETFPVADRLRRAGIAGIYTPEHPLYAELLRGFNLAVTHRPDVVVAATSVADVMTAVGVAAELDLTVSVIGLGHSATRPVVGGLALVTRGLAGVEIDPVAGTARVGAGTTWAEVLEAADPYGLAPLSGSAPHVGVIGYLLGGGIGPVARTYGFAADHVRSLTVVTADGWVVGADAEHHRELFWALRGGGSGLGVVVEVVIDLVPLRTLVAGGLYFSAADAQPVLQTFATWSAGLPETVTTSVALLRLPSAPELPEPLRGRFLVHLRVATVEPAERAEEILAPLRAVAHPLLDTVAEIPYREIGSVHADPVDPKPLTEGGVLLRAFDGEAADRLLAVAGPDVEVPLVAVEVRLLGGALARTPEVPNAVGGRDAAYHLHVVGVPVPAFDAAVRAVSRRVFAELAPWRGPGSQINFFGRANDPETWEACWPPAVAERLRAIRVAQDPQGRFAPAERGARP